MPYVVFGKPKRITLMHLPAALLCVMAVSFAVITPGHAQSQQGTSFSNGPINFTAASITNTPAGLAMRGKVELSQGANRFLADQMQTTVRNGEIVRVVATGNVYLVTAGENIQATPPSLHLRLISSK